MEDAKAEDLDQIVLALFARTPAEFTAARDARKREATGALAAAIGGIRKPTVAAWTVNLLTAEGGVADVLELGRAMREAQDDLDAAELARLGRQRRQLIAALARRAAELATERGIIVGASARAEVESTLTAALVDARLGTLVGTGRLIRSVAPGDEREAGEVVAGTAPATLDEPAAPPDDLSERRARREAERAAREAARARESAQREREQADARRARAQERLDGARQRVEAARTELAAAEADQATAEAELTSREEDAAAAAGRLRAAERTARAAAARAE